MSKKLLVLAAVIALVVMGAAQREAAAAAPDFSKMSVTCVVPYDAGGGTDAVMRGLADAAKVPSRTSLSRTVPARAEPSVCSTERTPPRTAQSSR